MDLETKRFIFFLFIMLITAIFILKVLPDVKLFFTVSSGEEDKIEQSKNKNVNKKVKYGKRK